MDDVFVGYPSHRAIFFVLVYDLSSFFTGEVLSSPKPAAWIYAPLMPDAAAAPITAMTHAAVPSSLMVSSFSLSFARPGFGISDE